MKRIAIFQTDLGIGGIEKSIVNLLNNLDLKKNEIDLYLFNKNEQTYLSDIPDDVNIIYLKESSSLYKFIPFKLAYKLVKKQVEKEYDLSIDFNSYSPDTAIQSLKTKASKHVIWVHNDIEIKLKEEPKYRILHHFFKAKYNMFDKFVAVSVGALESFKKIHPLENKEYDCIPNIINTEEIKNKMNDTCDLEVDNKVINLVTVGRLVHQKGFDILLKEYRNILDENDKYHLYIIGDGPERKNLESLINELNLNKYVTILGYKKNPFNYMNLMDAFILTSRYEGQGMVFLEAASIGLDIILPDHLSKYVEDIKPTKDIKKSVLSLKKSKHTFNDLKEYNTNIINKFNKL